VVGYRGVPASGGLGRLQFDFDRMCFPLIGLRRLFKSSAAVAPNADPLERPAASFVG